MNQNVRVDDLLEFYHSSGNLTEEKCSTSSLLFFERVSKKINLTFHGFSGANYRQYISNRTNDIYDSRGTINLNSCQFGVPGTTQPIQFEFTFSTKFNEDSYSSYARVLATLTPQAGSITDITFLTDELQINQLGTYTLSTVIGQPLSSNPMLHLSFPAGFNFDAFSIDSSANCEVLVEFSTPSSKDCYMHSSLANTVVIEIGSIEAISVGYNIEVSLAKIKNPEQPGPESGFVLKTYLNAGDEEGLVEVGSSFNSIVYQPQLAAVNLNDNTFTVNEGVNIEIVYSPGIEMLAGTQILITFNTVITGISYVSIGINASFTNSSSRDWVFTLSSDLLSTTDVLITFEVTTPSKLGLYPCFTLQTKKGGVVYEQTSDPIQLLVNQLAEEQFTIAPVTPVAGETSNYLIKFTQLVPHSIPYLMQVTFPSDTDLLNGQSACLQGCTNLIDISTGGVDIIQIKIGQAATANVQTIMLSSIKNRRSVGSSLPFSIKTLTTEN